MKNLNVKGEMPKADEGFYKDDKEYGIFLKYDAKENLVGSYTYQAGVLQGAFEEYFPGTTIVSRKGYYRNGLLDGTVYDFHKNGQVACESQYLFGQLNGCQREFSEEGKILRIAHFKADKLNGTYEKFTNGCLSWAGVYRNGNIVIVVRDRVYLAAFCAGLERRSFAYQ